LISFKTFILAELKMNPIATLPVQSTINYDDLAASYDYINTYWHDELNQNDRKIKLL
jgi:hypothetical protein